MTLCTSEEFLQLSNSELEGLISRDTLNVISEEQVYLIILTISLRLNDLNLINTICQLWLYIVSKNWYMCVNLNAISSLPRSTTRWFCGWKRMWISDAQNSLICWGTFACLLCLLRYSLRRSVLSNSYERTFAAGSLSFLCDQLPLWDLHFIRSNSIRISFSSVDI